MSIFSVYTLGCKVNQYESEAICQQLTAAGLQEGRFDERCDLYILNTCAVTEESTRKARQLLRRAHRMNPDAALIVAGCYAQLCPEDIAAMEGVDYVCGTRNKNTVCREALRLLAEGKRQRGISVPSDPEGAFEPMRITRFDRTRAYVKIEDGCNSHCTYCVIKDVRGRAVSRPREDIAEEVRGLAANGCREVVLTGIETSAYEYDLAGLMEEIASVPGIGRIRLGSLDPSFLKKDLVDRIARNPKAAPHFHLSVQSGASSVLARMKRKYNADMALRNITYMQEKLPGLQLSADIITGFPGETEEEFAKTAEFVKKVRFLHLHIFPYSQRPGTEAAAMPAQVPENVKNERLRALSALQEGIVRELLSEAVSEGKPNEILLETPEGGYWHGHTPEFFEAALPCAPDLEKGMLVPAKPVRAENEILICERTEKP